MKKIALIVGGLGQDGSYMADLLLKKNYKIVCISSQISNKKKWRHKFLNIEKKIIYNLPRYCINRFGSVEAVFFYL